MVADPASTGRPSLPMTILMLAAATSVSPHVMSSSRELWMNTYWACRQNTCTHNTMGFVKSKYCVVASNASLLVVFHETEVNFGILINSSIVISDENIELFTILIVI